MGWRLFAITFLGLCFASASEDPWAPGALVPPGGRSNLYQLDPIELAESVRLGKLHTQIYPVETTAMLPPLRPLQNFLEKNTGNPLKSVMQKLFKGFSGIKSVNDLFKWGGLHDYPVETDVGVYSVPYPQGVRPQTPMGVGVINRNGTPGVTVSCAGCHSANLFGKTVLGMTNRFPKANAFLLHGKTVAKYYNSTYFRVFEKATDQEVAMMDTLKAATLRMSGKMPLVLGLDTSLASVALSLNHRNPDAWATRNPAFEKNPRPDVLDTEPGDSKPAVWWNVKYKNRWLSDGSVVSGNPVFTNILWNEIGRGGDLKELDGWLKANGEKIKELTNAVFGTEAPRITDFFDVRRIDLARAQAGEKIFNQTCAKCHGNYEKNWSLLGSELLPYVEQIKTRLVVYTKTKIADVGTDPQRYLQMKSLEKLNDLQISKDHGTVIAAQKGYVAPPLVGIWARWPYFHNNSVPTLCDVLTVGTLRPAKYMAREALDPSRDFDFECNGYPLVSAAELEDSGGYEGDPERKNPFVFDSSLKGLSNRGHDEGIFIKNGVELLTPEDKRNLIQFLQTL